MCVSVRTRVQILLQTAQAVMESVVYYSMRIQQDMYPLLGFMIHQVGALGISCICVFVFVCVCMCVCVCARAQFLAWMNRINLLCTGYINIFDPHIYHTATVCALCRCL